MAPGPRVAFWSAAVALCVGLVAIAYIWPASMNYTPSRTPAESLLRNVLLRIVVAGPSLLAFAMASVALGVLLRIGAPLSSWTQGAVLGAGAAGVLAQVLRLYTIGWVLLVVSWATLVIAIVLALLQEKAPREA